MELHGAWNSYEPKAIADFAIQSSINDFESALNNLTKLVEMNDAYLSLLESTSFTNFFPTSIYFMMQKFLGLGQDQILNKQD